MKVADSFDIDDGFFYVIKDVKNKNCGGCLLFAYSFYLWLKAKNFNTDSFKIGQIGSDYAINNNLNWIDGHFVYASSSYHFIFHYNGQWYDSEGAFCIEDIKNPPYSSLSFCILDLNEDDLIDDFCCEALQFGYWNSKFDRQKYKPIIEDALGIDLSQIG